MGMSETLGSVSAMPTKAATMAHCEASSQLRRRPKRRVSQGRGKRSTSGAQTHLKP